MLQRIILLTICTILIMTSDFAQNKKAFINGNIYTVNDNQPRAEAVLVEGSRIKYVGTTAEVQKLIDSSTEVIDLGGKFMMPGFNDAHLHFLSGGFYLRGIDLRPAKSLNEFKSILSDYIKNYPDKWVTGGRWDHENWDVPQLPSRSDIDEITGSTPVFVSRMDGHMGLANL